MILERFGKDQHEVLIRQLFSITGPVSESVERFSELIDQLSAYEAHTDPLYYTLKFLDVLKDEIRSVIMVQRPSNLDTSCSLALVQEEVADSSRKKDIKRSDLYGARSVSKSAYPLPIPPRWINLWVVQDLMTNVKWNPNQALQMISCWLSRDIEEPEGYVQSVLRNGSTTINVRLL